MDPRWWRCLGVSVVVGLVALLPGGTRAESPRFLLLDAVAVGPRVVAVGERGSVVWTDDLGVSWKRAATPPTAATLTAVSFIGLREGWAVGHGSLILRTVDGGEHWVRIHEEAEEDSPLFDVIALGEGHVLAVGAFGSVMETRDNGAHWTRRTLGDDEQQPHLYALLAGKGAVLAVGEAGAVFQARDPAGEWSRLSPPRTASSFGGLVLPDQGILLFGLRGQILRWSPPNGPGDGVWGEPRSRSDATFLTGTLLPNRGVLLAGMAGRAVYSPDGGGTFIERQLPLHWAVSSVFVAPDGAWLVFGEGGVRRLSAAETSALIAGASR